MERPRAIRWRRKWAIWMQTISAMFSKRDLVYPLRNIVPDICRKKVNPEQNRN